MKQSAPISKTDQLKSDIDKAISTVPLDPNVFQGLAIDIGKLIADRIAYNEDTKAIIEDFSFLLTHTPSCAFKCLAIHEIKKCLEKIGGHQAYDQSFKSAVIECLQADYHVDAFTLHAISQFFSNYWSHTTLGSSFKGGDLSIEDQLFVAIKYRDIRQGGQFIDFFTKNGVDLNQVERLDKTPLKLAAEEGFQDIVQILIDNGADVNGKPQQRTPLMDAAQKGKKDAVQALLKNNADIDAVDKEGDTALHVAALAGQAEMCEFLMANGANVHAKNENGSSTLHFAARAGNTALCELFIANGVDVNCRDNDGCTPLILAGNAECIDTLLAHGADIGIENNKGETALFLAVRAVRDNKEPSRENENEADAEANKKAAEMNQKAMDAVKSMIDRGANVHHENRLGQTALFYVEKLRNNPCFSFLVDCGLDVHKVDNKGQSLLMQVAHKHQVNDIHLLIDNGLDVNQKDSDGRNALFHALACDLPSEAVASMLHTVNGVTQIFPSGQKGNRVYIEGTSFLETTRALVDCGIDVLALNKDGQTALDVAKEMDFKDTIAFLEMCFENVNLQKTIVKADDEIEHGFGF